MADGQIEAKLVALAALISGAATADFARNAPLPATIPALGLIRMEDGAPGAPVDWTAPNTEFFNHVVSVSIYSQAETGRATLIDAQRQLIGAAIDADRRLGDLCEWIEGVVAETDELPVEGAHPIRMERLAITLSYGVTNPLI